MSSRRLQGVLKTSWKMKNGNTEDVLKTCSRHVFKTSSRCLEDQQMFAGSVGPKFVFEKIKFKVLHYIQHDFICQRLGFRLSCPKSSYQLVTVILDYEILLRTYSDDHIKGNKYFFFIKGNKDLFFIKRCVANVLLKLNYL